MKVIISTLLSLLIVATSNFLFAQEKPTQEKTTRSPQQQTGKKKNSSESLPQGVELLSGIEFARPNGHVLLLDLYRPKNSKGPLPVVVFVHGGGWKNGSKKSGQQAAWLVPHGFALASISYRLTDQGQWPDQINDCYAAVRWLRQNANKYQLDPQYIGCWGSSAGGHLAALMGTRPYPGKEEISSKVQAVCDWYGPSELLTMPPNVPGNGRSEADIAKSNGAKLLGATVRDVPEKARDASALDHVSRDDAPFLIMHGDADKSVPLIQSQKLHEKLLAAGVSSTLLVLKEAGHGGKQFATAESKKAILDFFTSHLKPSDTPVHSRPKVKHMIDTHIHLYDPSRPGGIPWPPQDDKVLYKPHLPEDYKRVAKPAGVTGVIIAEASDRFEDNRWALDLVKGDPFFIALVGNIDPYRPDFAEPLKQLKQDPRFVGIRARIQGKQIDYRHPQVLANFRLLAEADLTLDILMNGEGVETIQEIDLLAQSIPKLRIVVNHVLGYNIDGKRPDEKWISAVKKLARNANVYVKVSGLYQRSNRQPAPKDVDYYRPLLDVIWESFGSERLLYGSNWPVTKKSGDYASFVALVHAYFAEKGQEACERYYWRNAARVYKLKTVAGAES